jgi:hypothetical protein
MDNSQTHFRFIEKVIQDSLSSHLYDSTPNLIWPVGVKSLDQAADTGRLVKLTVSDTTGIFRDEILEILKSVLEVPLYKVRIREHIVVEVDDSNTWVFTVQWDHYV